MTEMHMAQTNAADEKKLEDLVHDLRGDRLSLRDPCMKGIRNEILREIESRAKSAGGHNVVWIRGAPGVGKLAASIAIRLQEQH